MTYRFYGWEKANAKPVNDLYPSIRNPRDLYDALCGIWSAETCAPRLRREWSAENRTLGQCSITAFLAQDIFGGKVYGIELPDGSFHCYNVADGCRFDLASEQFGEKAGELVYDDAHEQFRHVHFADEDKKRRYEMLKEGLAKI
ncbi:MAG: hypothetical protein Q4D04_00815 [Clostridia bacterium]|nr:hypothetical protein [Clostridia bacterium]